MKLIRLSGLVIALISFSRSAPSAQPIPENFLASHESLLAGFRTVVNFSSQSELTPAGNSGIIAPDASETQNQLNLENLIALATSNNPAIQAAQSAVAAAQADLRSAKGQRLPSAKLESSASYIGNPLGPISVRAGQFGTIGGVAIPPEDRLIYKGMESTHYRFALVGSVPLYTWGKISQGIAIAERGLKIAELQYQKAVHETRLQVRGQYETLAYIRMAFEATTLNKRVGERLADIAERSASVGFLTAGEVLSARIQLKEIDIALARLEEQRDRILAQLARLCGIESLRDEEVQPPLLPAGRPRWTESETVSLMLSGSYDLQSLRGLVEVRDGLRQLAANQAKGLPDIGLQFELAYTGPRFPFVEIDWFRQNDYQLTISLGTSGNIFGNAVKSAEAARAAAQYQESVQNNLEAERGVRGFARETFLSLDLASIRLEFALLQQENWLSELRQKQVAIRAGAGDEGAYLRQLMEALGKLAEAYGTVAEYRAKLLTLEGAVGSAATGANPAQNP